MSVALRSALCGVVLALGSGCGDGGAAPLPPDLDAPLAEADGLRLGRAQQAMIAGLPEQVHALLGDLLERDPVPADVQFVAGSAAYDLHQYGEAVERLSHAVQQSPAYLPNASALGFAYLKLGDFEAARNTFQRIVDVAPDKHKAHYGLGLVALSLGELAAARASLTESLRLSPNYLKALYSMANLLDEEGRTEEALETVTVVTANWPAHDEALYLQGRLLTKLGREQEAEEVFARHQVVYSLKESLGGLGARLGSPTDGPALRLQMADLHARIGDMAEAGRCLSAALSLYPDDPMLQEAWSRLSQGR